MSLIFSCCLPAVFTGCSTGIEGTKAIKYSKGVKKENMPSPEEKFISGIESIRLKDWKQGRRFMFIDDRASLVFESDAPRSELASLKGKRVEYSGTERRITPGGVEQAVVRFSDGIYTYSYPTGKLPTESDTLLTSLDFPMLADLATVDQYRRLLQGVSLWTRNSLWYDDDGEKIRGRRFVKVIIDSVSTGQNGFLMDLSIRDENGDRAHIYMNPVNRGLESRTFPSLFLLTDPRERHTSISDEVWDLICRGLVRPGMTKEECKLALGNPDDVNTAHDWNQTIDIWNYNNGTFLHFQDGLLTKFRI
ncbi:MAG: DUF2845 domain-containing protein [Muribaculaceae bacterium]|nr:DUF2845 domain-containing protein [Muribaculaceae bacterium]